MSYRLLNCVLLLLLVPIFGIIASTTGTVDSHSEKSTIIIATGGKMDNLAFTTQVVQTHIDFNQKSVVKSTTEMERSLTLLQYRAVIIAHGNEDGIQIGKNILTWEKFGLMLETSPIKTFYLASCYSDRVKPYTSKQVFGFPGEIDAYVAGIDISKQIAQALDQENSFKFRNILAQENSVFYESRKIMIKQALSYKVYAAVLLDTDPVGEDYNDSYDWITNEYGGNWESTLKIEIESYFSGNFYTQFDVDLEITYFDTFTGNDSYTVNETIALLSAKRTALESVGRYFDIVIGHTMMAIVDPDYRLPFMTGFTIADDEIYDNVYNESEQNMLFFTREDLFDEELEILFCHEISHIFGADDVYGDDNRWTVMDYDDMSSMSSAVWDQISQDEINPWVAFYDNVTDLDGDLMPDSWEDQYSALDPTLSSDDDNDPDYDGLSNYQEYLLGTDPMDSDTDDDDMPDGWEVTYSVACDPLDPDDADEDYDSDGYSNLAEYIGDTDPTNPSSHPPIDTDGDGWPDIVETVFGSDQYDDESTPYDHDKYDYHSEHYWYHWVPENELIGKVVVEYYDGETLVDTETDTTATTSHMGSDCFYLVGFTAGGDIDKVKVTLYATDQTTVLCTYWEYDD